MISALQAGALNGLRQAVQPGRVLLQAGLVMLLGYQGAQLTWQVLMPPETPESWQKQQVQSQPGQRQVQFSIAPLQRLSLFGKAEKVAPAPVKPKTVTQAPTTRLNLKLHGVTATANGLGGVAIIEANGQRDVYIVGDELVKNQATLQQILHDRVLIERAGQLETLMLQGEDGNTSSSASSSSRQTSSSRTNSTPSRTARQEVDKRDDEQLIQTLAAKRDELTSIEGISKHLRVAPVQGQDGVRGYRLRPGGSAELFRMMGLRSGDIAVNINGYDLADQAQAMQALAELSEAQEASVTVERQGQLVDLYFTLPQ